MKKRKDLLRDKDNFIHIVEFKEIFPHEQLPANRLELIKTIPKNTLVWIFSHLNKLLKSPVDLNYDMTLEKQIELLKYLCNGNKEMARPYILAMGRIYGKVRAPKNSTGIPMFISRVLCLHALQEIVLDYNGKYQEIYTLTDDDILNLLKYIACVNEHIAVYKKRHKQQLTFHEELLSAGIVLNEPLITVMPFKIFNWYMKLIEFFQSDSRISQHIADYFKHIGFTPQQFLHLIGTMYLEDRGNYNTNRHTRDDVDGSFTHMFEFMSKNINIRQRHELDIIPIRKYPIYKIKESDRQYIILDFVLLLEKMYEMFINDFYFDWLKAKDFMFDEYMGIVGKFFEGYCSKILNRMFEWSDSKIQCTSENKIYVGKNEDELCDVYYREGKNILFGEMKATGIYSSHREGFTDSMFGEDKEKFYKSISLNQLIKNIRRLHEYGEQIDEDFPTGSNTVVYPILILNEKYYRATYVPVALQERIIAEFEKEKLPSNIIVRPITVIHISDLEAMEEMIHKRKITIWELLKRNYIKNPQKPNPISFTMERTRIPPTPVSEDFMEWLGLKEK